MTAITSKDGIGQTVAFFNFCNTYLRVTVYALKALIANLLAAKGLT